MNGMRWDVLTIGNITRNRFWGEGDDRPLRPVLATSTLIRTAQATILVDPSEDTDAMRATLFRRAGIGLADIDIVYITHHHGDHAVATGGYPRARLLMPAAEIEASGLGGLSPVQDGDQIAQGVFVISLPGHTDGLCGLLFTAAEGRVAVVGDAVMTKDFFAARAGYFNSVDMAQCAATHEKLAGIADIIVPGHDNYFLVSAAKP